MSLGIIRIGYISAYLVLFDREVIIYREAGGNTHQIELLSAGGGLRTISNLVARLDNGLCVDDDLFLAVDRDNFGRTVRRAAMIDEATKIETSRSVATLERNLE